MPSTKWNPDVRELLRETMARYPSQPLPPETQKAYLEDWRAEAARVGFARFKQGVEGARAYSEFFPMIGKIRKHIPEPRNDDIAFQREMADLRRRKLAGERFYTLADVFVEFARRVIAGEIKGRDDRGQKALETWAKALRKDAKGFAERMLAMDGKRTKGELESIAEIAKKLA